MIDASAHSPSDVILEARHVSRYFADAQVMAVDDVSFSLQENEFVSLTGKSGCGKSTLLNLLGGLDLPTAGEILFQQKPLAQFTDLAQFRSEKLGFVFQSFHLIHVLTASQNVQLPLFESPLTLKQRAERANQLLAQVGMSHRAHHPANRLSGGERQRVAIARALARDPQLILADEPTGNLDSKTAKDIIDLFLSLRDNGKTILMVTHDQALANVASRIITMNDGKIVASQDPQR